jgi:hypothetical protein
MAATRRGCFLALFGFVVATIAAPPVFGQTVTLAPDKVTTDGRSNVVMTLTPAPTEEARKLTNTRRVTVGGINAAFFATGEAGRLSFVAPPQDSPGDRDVKVVGDNALELAGGRLTYVEPPAASGSQRVGIVVTWIGGLVIAALAVVVIVLIAFGRISLDGLLSDENGKPSLARFQFLVFTFVIALGLFIIVLNSKPPSFPAEVPNGILMLLGLSGSGFLVSKGIDVFRQRR